MLTRAHHADGTGQPIHWPLLGENMIDYTDARAFLETANIMKLQSAARMAGLRWKSGDPAFNKAGIIDKLMQHPSICRACIAQLERMNPSAPTRPAIDFSQDLTDDDDEPASPQAAQPSQAQFHQAVLEVSIKALLSRMATNESLDRSQFEILSNHQTNMEKLTAAVSSLQEQKPIQFNFPAREPILIDPKGHHADFPKLVKYLQINRRVILCGQAGTGKSIAVKNAAKALNVPFYLLAPVTMSHELIGHRDAQGVFHETPLTLAYKHGGLCLLDESDASLPDALLVANPILDGNGFAMLGDGKMHEQHPDFLAVFNMNTDGNGATMQYAGRNRLDGATLARFGVRIDWGIDADIEREMSQGQTSWLAVIHAIRGLMDRKEIVDVNATPRHLKTGAALLRADCPRREVLVDCLKSGALAGIWTDVERLPEVSRFLQGF